MTAKEAKYLKHGDKVIRKLYADEVGKKYAFEETVDYVVYNPSTSEYDIVTMKGHCIPHKRAKIAVT